jgi:hypothetical protein
LPHTGQGNSTIDFLFTLTMLLKRFKSGMTAFMIWPLFFCYVAEKLSFRKRRISSSDIIWEHIH